MSRHVAKLYGEGVIEGMRISLQLFLGIVPPEGGAPCPQPLPDDAEVWARAALDRIEADQGSAAIDAVLEQA